MTEHRVGIVGLGVISRYYVRALAQVPGLSLAAVCDHDDRALLAFAGTVPCYRDYREMLARERLDALVVTLPNDAHADACLAALSMGVAVCVEKPLALTSSDGEEIVAYARSRGVVNFTAFHRRYNAGVVALRRRLTPRVPISFLSVRYWERIEDHVQGDSWYLDADRCGGGCVADNGPNACDLARLFLGELRLTAAAIERDAAGTDRRAKLTLTAAGGATAHIDLDWSYPGERKELEVQFADGSTDHVDMLAGHPGFKESLWHEYVGVLEAFRDRLSASASASASAGALDDGLAALTLVDAAYRCEIRGAGTR